ncbi:MAG: PepSY domain-containing protein [Planctomycetes bacterium]|nr:PepSY domain-containing protein [Planctomycetota bacterium]
MSNAVDRKSWPDYRAVWRWHFYASLFCMPFVVMLSVTGAVYLFKTEIEDWNDRPYDHLSIDGEPATVEAQVRAALATVPDSIPSAYEIPRDRRSAARVIVRQKTGELVRAYVHPQSLQILHTIPENDRLMRTMFRLHGELLMGDRGSNVVELAASWTIIMIVTGLYLWWPRGLQGWGGIAYPRFHKGSKIFWRDVHSVTGVWISVLALFLLATGLPWAKFWGNYFKTIRQATGTAVAQQDWTTGSEKPTGSARATGGSGEHAGHGGSGSGRSRRGGNATMPRGMAAFDRVAKTVIPLGLEHPVLIAPPARGDGNWSAKSNTPNRPHRVNLTVNGADGTIVTREDFKDRHFVDRIVGIGIAAHEGRLFGWPNQALGLLTAVGLILLSISGVIMWWRRRDPGELGAPRRLVNPQFSAGLAALVVVLGIYLPLFAASLAAVLLVEWILLRRIAHIRNWLGLSPSIVNSNCSPGAFQQAAEQ